jgi:predicted DNA-binding ribbon-helix-helix protein
LPAKLEKSFWDDLAILEEERKMPFVTSVEKIGYERGKKEAQQKIDEIVLKMLEDRVPLETIAKFTDLSIVKLKRFANKHSDKIQSQQK